MLLEFESYLKDKFPYLLKEKSILCCSGGIDSVVLFHLMLSLSKDFVVAHCNFKLRGIESDQDEDFVRDLCKENSIKFYTKSFDVKKIKAHSNKSIQMIARDLRYVFFDQLSSDLNIKHVLTAHHLNDSLEGFIINISRGSGLDGLTGIPIENNKIKRPLICFEKSKIIEYAKSNNLNWREDSSNKTDSYLRNQIRNNIIPEFEKLEGNFIKNFKKSISYLQISNTIIHGKINELKKNLLEYRGDEIAIKIKNLQEVNSEAFLYYFLRDFGFIDWNNIFKLIHSESGKKVLSESHILFRNKLELILRPVKQIKKINHLINDINNPFFINNSFQIKFKKTTKISKNNSNVVTVDIQKLKFPLLVRNFKDGDSFYPFGMDGNKKVGKFLKDNNVNHVDKQSAVVLVNGDNKIIWVIGMRLDNRFSVLENTQKLLNIEYCKKN
jgi:tRNA(Ile)-lysidine synthase